MTQIPRKPTFPSYMVQKLRAKIQTDVQEDVIPVSTGIYSYQKLKNKLQAIPKPQIQNYQDKAFFEIIEDRLVVADKTGQKCTSCDEEYNKKNVPVMCNFCGFFCCSNCISRRKRPHPLSKDGSGKRYNQCQRCDTKYLNLQLGHSYVENRTLLQQAILKTSLELQNLIQQAQEYQHVIQNSKQAFEKNKFKISQLRKEKLQITKQIKSKIPQQIQEAQDKQEQLKLEFVDVHIKHKEWLQFKEFRRKQKEQRQRQKQEKQRQQEQQTRRVLQEQKQRQDYQKQEFQRRQTEKLRKYNQQQQDRRIKKKKIPSLQQNSILSINLNGTNSLQDIDKNNSSQNIQEHTYQTTTLKKSFHHFGGYDSYRRQQSQQQEEFKAWQLGKSSQDKNQELIIPKCTPQNTLDNTKQQNQNYPFLTNMDSTNNKSLFSQESQFAQYFRKSQPQNKFQTVNQSVYQQPMISTKKSELQCEGRIDNFTFNEKMSIVNTDHNQDVLNNFNRCSRDLQNDNDRKTSNQQQYTFQDALRESDSRKDLYEEEPEEIPISVPKNIHFQHQQQAQNQISQIQQWYVQKSVQNQNQTTNNENQNHYRTNGSKKTSSLSTAVTSQFSNVQLSNLTRTNERQEELEEQCGKSTSELDQQELEVARYSLIKAARDSAVEQRQRNKIYQKSIYQSETAPYDQEEDEGVGEIKKCQCFIY